MSKIYLERAQDFVKFVNKSRSAFHAVAAAKASLVESGFHEISETTKFNVKPGGCYFYTRNQSSLVAFVVGGKFRAGNGFSIIGAHTDSPCLKVKPLSNIQSHGYNQIGISTYGGGIWATWFDRDLSIAGRVIVETEKGFETRLVYVDRPIMRIPTLAIHLDRTVNEAFKFNTETNLLPLIETQIKAQLETKSTDPHNNPLVQLIADTLQVEKKTIHDYELTICDCQDSVIGGINNEFIFSGRLDNLMSSYCGLQALRETSKPESLKNEDNVRMLLLFDHEEIGSRSAFGAMSPLMNDAIQRICDAVYDGTDKGILDLVQISRRKSFIISADMAHAVHPNYGSKHENNHRPAIHKGPVIKTNVEQRYATTLETSFIIEHLSKKHDIPTQKFVVRNDSPCGSTIGPILSGESGIRTVDIGNPQLSMHSIREMCGTDDTTHCINLMKAFYEEFSVLDKTLKVD